MLNIDSVFYWSHLPDCLTSEARIKSGQQTPTSPDGSRQVLEMKSEYSNHLIHGRIRAVIIWFTDPGSFNLVNPKPDFQTVNFTVFKPGPYKRTQTVALQRLLWLYIGCHSRWGAVVDEWFFFSLIYCGSSTAAIAAIYVTSFSNISYCINCE